MDYTAMLTGLAGLALGAAKPIADALSGKDRRYLDQLQTAIEECKRAQDRCEKLERKISAQALDQQELMRQVARVEIERDKIVARLQSVEAAHEALQAELDVATEHIKALSAQIEGLGHSPAPAPQPKKRSRR